MNCFFSRFSVQRLVIMAVLASFCLEMAAAQEDTNVLAPVLRGSAVQWQDPSGLTVADLLNTATALINQHWYEQGMQDLALAYQQARNNGNEDEISEVLASMVRVAYETDDYDQAKRYYEQLLEAGSGDQAAQAVALFNLGHVSASWQHYTLAEREFTEALVLSEILNDSAGQAFALKTQRYADENTQLTLQNALQQTELDYQQVLLRQKTESVR